MLITLTTKQEHADTLASALQIDLKKAETHQFKFGRGYVFFSYPSDESISLNLLVDCDPYELIDYQKNLPNLKPIPQGYIAVRPYTTSSFTSLLIARAFRSVLLNVKTDKAACDKKLPLTINIPCLPCIHGQKQIENTFAPLNYKIEDEQLPWDEDSPGWGNSIYHNVTLSCDLSVYDCLKHLYVMLPTFDFDKFQWLERSEIDAIEEYTDETFSTHPQKEELKATYQEENNYLNIRECFHILRQVADDAIPYKSEEIIESEEDQQFKNNIVLKTLLNTLDVCLNENLPTFINTKILGGVPINGKDLYKAVKKIAQSPVSLPSMIYQPPTMSFPPAAELDDHFEHPQEVFDYYQAHGIDEVICEEKHMGGRVIVIVCKDEKTARKRFRLEKGQKGIYVFRSTLSYYNPPLIDHMCKVLTKANYWEHFNTDWFIFDAEYMPWSNTARTIGPILSMYMALAINGNIALNFSIETLQEKHGNDAELINELVSKYKRQLTKIESYHEVIKRYSYPVEKIEDIKIAPFHILATENQMHTDKTHEWHMQHINYISSQDDDRVIYPTQYLTVPLNDDAKKLSAIDWWKMLVENGSEGVVIKPLQFVAMSQHGMLQPAIKCRGHDFLRLPYGPQFDEPDTLNRLKARTTLTKERLACQEFALGIESIERFVKNEPPEKIFETFSAALALELSYKN